MAANLTEGFILGKDRYPDWFVLLDRNKRILYEYDSKGELKGVTIKHSVKYMTAKVGDTILNMSGNIIVVPKKAADKYMKG